MILYRLISWPYARKHLVRSLLTTAGIVLGVAVFVGMHTANRSVLAAFNKTVNRIAGAAQLQVTAGEAGFDEAVLDRVQALPEVRVAVPVIEAVVNTALKGQGNLLILAVDMTGDRSLRDYDFEAGDEDIIDDPLVFLAQPDSLIITREFAARNGLATGSRLAMPTMDGQKNFTVRGIMRSSGLASAFAGNIAVMDIYAAQKVFGRGRKFDRIDLAVKEGVPVDRCQAALRNLLGPGFSVDPPSERGAEFESLLAVYSAVMNITSLFALFIGMFIIYNSFAIAVTQRRFEIGILRALGATRAQIRTLFLGESAIAGLAGSATGILAGFAAARGLSGYIGHLLEGMYGVADRPEQISLEPKLVWIALLIGVVTSMIAAWLPARNAARVDPVKALQKGGYQMLSEGENRMRRRIAVVLTAFSLALLFFGKTPPLFWAGYLVLVVAVLLLTPALALWLARALRIPLKLLRPVEGALAADSLIQAPRRTSATVAALMLALSLVIALGGMTRASYDSINEWLRTTLNPDLFVSASENVVVRSFHFPGSMQPELAAISGIQEVQAVRSLRITVRGRTSLLVALEMTKVANRTRGRHVIAGGYDEMHRLASAGQGVIIAENVANLDHVGLGDTLELATPRGLLRLPVVGILRDYSDQQGTVFLDRGVYLRYWNDDTADIFRIYLQPGASAEEVKRAILEKFSGQRRLFVMFNQELRSYILRLVDQWFGITYVQIAVAVLVAVLGIVNTLTVSITDRRRELGVLRAVGGLRRQIRRTLWLEGLTIGTIGIILGFALGAVSLYYQLQVIVRDFSGLPLDYEYPVTIAALLVPVILVAALGAAIGPAESAVRSSLVQALEYE
jgi:putative ABC transport system permease protein